MSVLDVLAGSGVSVILFFLFERVRADKDPDAVGHSSGCDDDHICAWFQRGYCMVQVRLPVLFGIDLFRDKRGTRSGSWRLCCRSRFR